MTLTLPRLRPAPVQEPELPKKPRKYPSLREAWDKGGLIAPVQIVGHVWDGGKRACAWGRITLGFGDSREDFHGLYVLSSGYGPKSVGALSFAALHMQPPLPSMSPHTTIRDAVISMNDRGHWHAAEFEPWLSSVDRAIEEHCG